MVRKSGEGERRYFNVLKIFFISQQVLGERYSTETKALDLTDMFHDQSKFH